MGVVEVVDHNVKCGQEGVHVEHEGSVPFPWGSGSRPTLERGHLPLKSSIDNSHQAFKASDRGKAHSRPVLTPQQTTPVTRICSKRLRLATARFPGNLGTYAQTSPEV